MLLPLPIRLFVAVPADTPPWFLWATFAIDSGKALFTATALKHFIRNPMRFETVRDFGVYCLFRSAARPALSAFAGAAARIPLGQEQYWSGWEQWLLGDALANLIITPAIFYWLWVLEENHASVGPGTRWLEGALLTAGLILTSYIAFQSEGGEDCSSPGRAMRRCRFCSGQRFSFGARGASGGHFAPCPASRVVAALQGVGLFPGSHRAK